MKVLKIILLKIIFISTTALSMNIQVFTNGPCTNSSVSKNKKTMITCYDLGKPKELVDDINKAIYGKPSAKAEQEAKNIIKSDKPKFMQAVEGLRLAHQYGLQKLPAIAFDNGSYINYGTTDISIAKKNYKKFIRENNDKPN